MAWELPHTVWFCIRGQWKWASGQYSRGPRISFLDLDHSWPRKQLSNFKLESGKKCMHEKKTWILRALESLPSPNFVVTMKMNYVLNIPLTLQVTFRMTAMLSLAMTLTLDYFDIIKSTDALRCLLIVSLHSDFEYESVHYTQNPPPSTPLCCF